MVVTLRLTEMSVSSPEVPEGDPQAFTFHAEADVVVLDHHGTPLPGITENLHHVEVSVDLAASYYAPETMRALLEEAVIDLFADQEDRDEFGYISTAAWMI